MANIEPILRRFHHGGAFERLDTSALDHHLRDGRLDDLMSGLSGIRDIVVELADPEYDMFRSYQLYVGLELNPAWHAFNRELTDEKRAEAILDAGRLQFWLIRLSRLAPAWMSFWNEFLEINGRIVPRIVNEPSDWEWKVATAAVRNVLTELQWSEVDDSVLDTPVEWLETSMAQALVARSRSPHPTVREALFTDCY